MIPTTHTSMNTNIVVMHYFKNDEGVQPLHLLTISNGSEGRLIIAKQTTMGELALIKEPVEKYMDMIAKNDKLKDLVFKTYAPDITQSILDFSELSLLDEATKGIADLLLGSSSMTINLSDMLDAIQADGFAVIYTGYATGESRAEQVLTQIRQNYNPQSSHMKAVLLSLHHPERSELTLDEITTIVKGIEDTFGKHAEFRYSYRANSTIGENIGITVIAA